MENCCLLFNTMTLQPLGNSSTTTGLSWVGDTQEENTQRTIFLFKKFNLPLSTEQKFQEKWNDVGKKLLETLLSRSSESTGSLQTSASCRAPPESGILAPSLLCNCNTKSFPPVKWGWLKRARFTLWVWTEVLRLPWKESTIQAKSVHVMMIPNPAQGWSSSCTSVAAVVECS